MPREKLLEAEAILVDDRITIAPGQLSPKGFPVHFSGEGSWLLAGEFGRLNIKHTHLVTTQASSNR